MSSFHPVSVTFTTAGHPVTVHLFSTGRGIDKTRFREARLHNRLSVLDAIFDSRFTEWLPIWVAVIQHPEGNFLIDTGLSEHINDPGYFKDRLIKWYIASQFHFEITPEESIPQKFQQLNIDTITAIILTHLHFDHIGGLHHFSKTPILLNRQEWDHPFGALPKTYPKEFKPTFLDSNSPLTTTGDLILVHTPGHTPGHSSVLLKTDSCHILFGGDICYTQQHLLQEKMAANLASYKATKETYHSIKNYARQHPLVFLPTHDPDSGIRLQQQTTIF